MNPFTLAGSGGSSGGSSVSTAADVPFVPAGTIEATNVQTAIEEVDDTLTNNLFWNLDGDGNIVPIATGGVYEGNAFGDLDVETADFSTATYVIPWGFSDVTTQIDITSSTTLQNITGLVQSGLLATKRYAFNIILFVTNTSNNGIKLAFATPDTLTATSIIATADSFSSTGSLVKHTKITGLTDSMCAATAAIERVEIKGSITVNAGGTLRLQVAQNASHADTLSVLVGSNMRLWQVAI